MAFQDLKEFLSRAVVSAESKFRDPPGGQEPLLTSSAPGIALVLETVKDKAMTQASILKAIMTIGRVEVIDMSWVQE